MPQASHYARRVLVSSLCLALLVAAAGYWGAERARGELGRAALRQQSTLVSALAAGLDARVLGVRDALASLSGSLAPALGAGPAALERELRSGAAAHLFPGGLWLLRPDGVVLASLAPDGVQLTQNHAFSDSLKIPLAGRPFIASPVFSPSQQRRLTVMFSVPVRSASGTVAGVLCGIPDLSRPDFLGTLAGIRPGPGGRLIIADRSGTLLLPQEPGGIPRKPAPLPLGRSGGAGSAWSGVTRQADGVPMLTSTRELAGAPWTLVARVPLEGIYRGIPAGATVFWGLLLLAWGVALPLFWWLGSRLPARGGKHGAGRGPAHGDPEAPGMAGVASDVEEAAGKEGAGKEAATEEAATEEAATEEGAGEVGIWSADRPGSTLGDLQLLQAALDALPTPIFYKGADGRYLWVNRAFEEYLGRDRSQVLGRSVFEISPPELAQRYHQADLELLARGGEQRYESEVAYADGTRRDVIFYKAVYGAPGSPGGIVGTVLDITERKRIEDRFRILSCAVEQSPSIVVITDASGAIEYVNRKFEEVTGYTSAEVQGVNPRILKAGITAEQVYQELWSTIAAGGEWRGEFSNRKKNGELYQETAVISPVHDDRGVISHFIALKEDVTQRRAMERALRHAQKMESLGTLTGGVAHDFNNILTAIIGYANLIQMKSAPEDPCARFAAQVAASAEKAAVLTRGLLAYSRNQAMNPAHLDLNEIVGRVDRLLSRVLGEAIAYSTTLHPEPLRIFADSGQLEQMLMNLAVNAKEAMPEGGTLKIGSGSFVMDEDFVRHKGFGIPGRYALISVADSGVGLDQETCERIFEPFFTTHGVGGGPGLGLSIVHGIVEQHKGYIEVESAPGEGTVFRVYFPVAAPVAVREPVRRPGRGGETVLLVEDNPEVRGIIGEILRGERYQVLEAADSEEGMRRFMKEGDQIRLLLVDVVMPGRGGLELYREIKTMNSGVRVLFMSGYPEEQIRSRGVLASDVAFISKPLAPADLLTRVRDVLDAA